VQALRVRLAERCEAGRRHVEAQQRRAMSAVPDREYVRQGLTGMAQQLARDARALTAR
jgi:hypothetical protein